MLAPPSRTRYLVLAAFALANGLNS
jgi:MFS family permease